jgi:hypothetical protein
MSAQPSTLDVQAIYQAVLDYYDGWYEGNAERMERSLHTDLTKRSIKHDQNGKEYLRRLTKEQMVEATKRGGGTDAPQEKRNWTVTILDQYEEIATVKVAAGEYREYIHLARQDGQWLIVNVLYTLTREI